MSETAPKSEGGTASEGAFRADRAVVAIGALLSVLGLVAIVFPYVTGLSVSIALGALLVVGALFHAAHAFSASGWKGTGWQVLLAAVYAVAGVGLLVNPVLGLTTLTLLLIGYFLADGGVEIVLGLMARDQRGWVWLVASGVISLLLAGLLWAGFPSTAAWAVGLLFGVSLLSSGVAMIFVGRRGTSAGVETATAT